jgi:hypothetical protein
VTGKDFSSLACRLSRLTSHVLQFVRSKGAKGLDRGFARRADACRAYSLQLVKKHWETQLPTLTNWPLLLN